jgi:N-acetylmannosamine-6-phosphate 2-epimerase/N-acetylmannosamine kinase
MQGVENLRAARAAFPNTPLIGLIKRAGADVFITPELGDVADLLAIGCEVIAFDATLRPRPTPVPELINAIHAGGALALADIDTLEAAKAAVQAGADLVSTTLSGYTADSPTQIGPDLELVRTLAALQVPVLAEGRYAERWQVEAALRAGAVGVVAGGALNDPLKQTRALWPRLPSHDLSQRLGAVDIGGTWLRFAVFDPTWKLLSVEREPLPKVGADRVAWIKSQIEQTGVARVGVSTAGEIDPKTGIVWRAKEHLIPDHVGLEFSARTLGVPTVAWGDGHATAWAHACLPQFAGRRVATLAIGTGVGCGFVQQGAIWAGPRGEYPRINDLPATEGGSYEDLLGGIHLTATPTDEQRARALIALEGAVAALRGLYFPDDLVLAGGVGLSDWLAPEVARLGAIPSPLGHDAGLYGAAALALFHSAH